MSDTTRNNSWRICGARILDPVAGTDSVRDIGIVDGVISSELPAAAPLIDAHGLVLVPALIDLHVHLREPGNETAETVASGIKAAARGGFGTIVAMPNTTPATDTADRVTWLIAKAAHCGLVDVLPSGCITIGRKGRALADLQSMAKAGAVAFTDDGSTVPDAALMAAAMAASAHCGRPLMDHALDPGLAGQGAMHEGEWSRRWNLPGISSESEFTIVARDIELGRTTGCHVHIQHVSTRESVDLIRKARAAHLMVTAEATPHHLALTDADVRPDNPAAWKMNPPVRTAADREALIEAVCDGAITCFATDHAPHTPASKSLPFAEAAFGVVGLETAVGITYTELVLNRGLSIIEWLKRWTVGPAGVIGLPPPRLVAGCTASLTLLDLAHEWTVDPARFVSCSRNTPFAGRRLIGRAVATFNRGISAWNGSHMCI